MDYVFLGTLFLDSKRKNRRQQIGMEAGSWSWESNGERLR
jgi:hypothetical protein